MGEDRRYHLFSLAWESTCQVNSRKWSFAAGSLD
jgi:hypothetical protein